MAAMKNRARLWIFVGGFVLIVVIYLWIVFPWMLHWGASPAELVKSLPGDDVVSAPWYRSTRALTIAAAVEEVWPWVAQLGQDRGGFYSYTWVENMLLADIHNARAVNPDWLEREAGELLPLTPPNYPLGLVRRKEGSVGPHIRSFEPNSAMVLDGWGSFVLLPIGIGYTRLIIRDPTKPLPLPAQLLWKLLFEPGHFAMERQMMKGIKARAEAALGAGTAGQSLATTGFILTALSGALFIALLRRKPLWLALPLVYAVLILIAAADPQAALVGFTALVLVIAGILHFRGWWWAYLLAMFVYANAVLLVNWEAYTAFGLIFLAAFLLLVLRLLSKKELVSSIKSREEARLKSRV
jgi:hypothetical protein